MAIIRREPSGAIHHSDRGSQYTALLFGLRCRQAGIRPSIGSTGDCYCNAICESFFATLECELIDRRQFKNKFQVEMEIFDFIQGWYNSLRRHSSIGYHSPINYERAYHSRLNHPNH